MEGQGRAEPAAEDRNRSLLLERLCLIFFSRPPRLWDFEDLQTASDGVVHVERSVFLLLSTLMSNSTLLSCLLKEESTQHPFKALTGRYYNNFVNTSLVN